MEDAGFKKQLLPSHDWFSERSLNSLLTSFHLSYSNLDFLEEEDGDDGLH